MPRPAPCLAKTRRFFLFPTYTSASRRLSDPVQQGEDFAGDIFSFVRNFLVKRWPSTYPSINCCCLIAVIRWLVDCPDLVAVGKLLWVAFCELLVF